jgi:putative transposase
MKYHKNQFSVEKMCRVFKVSRSGYYQWQYRKPSNRAIENKTVLAMVRKIYTESKGRYGSPKITQELLKKDIIISRPRIARIMRNEGLKSIIHRKYRVCTTDSNHNNPIANNWLNREFTVAAPGKKWVSDITYVGTKEGWLYLTIIMDLFDRKIVGWSLSKTLKTCDTVLPAFRMAANNRAIEHGLIFHSDRGSQYASNEIIKALKEKKKGIIQSMSRKANCWDNAVAKSFFKILKSELVFHREYKTHIKAKMEIFEFIEVWYNRQRSHENLGYKSPSEFEKQYYLNVA